MMIGILIIMMILVNTDMVNLTNSDMMSTTLPPLLPAPLEDWLLTSPANQDLSVVSVISDDLDIDHN